MRELHLSVKEMDEIPYKDLFFIYKGLKRLSAREKLENMDVHAYPWMDKKAQKECHKRWYKKAYPIEDRPKIKTEDLILV